tara:strand:+ start:2437 stop:2649 length:213 start_codon:yes stop_codon:yes gene_type:complete
MFDDCNLGSGIRHHVLDFLSTVGAIGGHNYGTEPKNRYMSYNELYRATGAEENTVAGFYSSMPKSLCNDL